MKTIHLTQDEIDMLADAIDSHLTSLVDQDEDSDNENPEIQKFEILQKKLQVM